MAEKVNDEMIWLFDMNYFYHDDSSARYYNTGRMGDLSLTIACNAGVLSDVFVTDGRYP